jgi:hypothetical protein
VACVKKRNNIPQIVILVHRNLSFYMRHKKCSLFLKLVFKCRMSGAACGYFYISNMFLNNGFTCIQETNWVSVVIRHIVLICIFLRVNPVLVAILWIWLYHRWQDCF